MNEGLGILITVIAFALMLGWLIYDDGYKRGYDDAMNQYEVHSEVGG